MKSVIFFTIIIALSGYVTYLHLTQKVAPLPPVVVDKTVEIEELQKQVLELQKLFMNIDIAKANNSPSVDVIKVGKVKETSEIFVACHHREKFYTKRVYIRDNQGQWSDMMSLEKISGPFHDELENIVVYYRGVDDFACGDCYVLPAFPKRDLNNFFGLTH